MLGNERRYIFPGGVRLRLVTDERVYLSHFDAEYGSLSDPEPTTPDLEVHIGRRARLTLPAAKGSKWFACCDGHKITRWRVALRVLGSKTVQLAFAARGPMSPTYLQCFYVEPLLRLKLLEAGYALVHGCTLIRETRSILFIGESSVGKTTLALGEVRQGRPIQGDNYVILSPGGETYAFPRRARIYSDLQRVDPDAFRALPVRGRVLLKFAGCLKRLSFGHANLPYLLRFQQLAPGCRIVAAARLGRVFVLKRHTEGELAQPRVLTWNEVSNCILAISRAEGSRLRRLVEPHIIQGLDPTQGKLESTEREILAKALGGVTAFEILVPSVPNARAVIDNLVRLAGADPPGLTKNVTLDV